MTLNLGLFGFGCVGQGLWDVLHRTPGLRTRITRICVKDRDKHRPLPPDIFTFEKDDILNDDDVHVVVELIDDAEAAFEIVRTAMKNGKAVVTANKKMVAEHFAELLELQRATGQPLLYEASTAGSIPIIRNLEEYYDNDLLGGVEGIVNGTSNFILTKLATDPSKDYAEVLAEAQRLGFAESDPTLDVGGWDAAYKTLIIAAHSVGSVLRPHQVIRRGIDTITPFDLRAAAASGATIKHVSRIVLHDGGFLACALPSFIPHGDALGTVANETNAIRLHGAFANDQLLVGKGAGAHPTASAVLSDLAALRYQYRYEYKKLLQGNAPSLNTDVEMSFYVRGPHHSLDAIPFSSVHTEHRTTDGRYIIGTCSAKAMAETEAFHSDNCFVAVTG